MPLQTLGHFKIVKTPPGPAPLEIREKWVGRILPAHAIIDAKLFSEISGQEMTCSGICVVQEYALEVLSKDAPAAAAWFRREAARSDADSTTLIFRSDHIERVGPPWKKDSSPEVRQYFGLLEVGVGAHDHPANLR